MSHLLKQKSKVQAVSKPRVKYDPFDFEKRFRDANGNAQKQTTPKPEAANQTNKGANKNKIQATFVEKYDVKM